MANPALDATIQAIRSTDTVLDSALQFIQTVPSLINTGVQQALGNGATAEQLEPLTDLSTELTAKANAVKEAIVANTPQATARR